MQLNNVLWSLLPGPLTLTLHHRALLWVSRKFDAPKFWDFRDEAGIAMRTIRMDSILSIDLHNLFPNTVVASPDPIRVSMHIECSLILKLIMQVVIVFCLVVLDRCIQHTKVSWQTSDPAISLRIYPRELNRAVRTHLRAQWGLLITNRYKFEPRVAYALSGRLELVLCALEPSCML